MLDYGQSISYKETENHNGWFGGSSNCKMLKTITNIKLFEVTVPEETGGRIALMKLLRQTVEEKIGRSGASITSDFLGDLIAYLGDSVPPLEKTQVEKDMEKVKKEYKQLKLKQEAELKQLKKKQLKIAKISAGVSPET